MTVRTGDWVRVNSKGFWRVQHVVPPHYEPRYSLSDRKQLYAGTLYLLKRIVNDKWKPAFDMTAAHESLMKPLNKADSRKLSKFLDDNTDVIADFDAFSRPVDAILNLGFALPRRSDFRAFKAEFESTLPGSLAEGMTSDAILKVIADSDFASNLGDSPRDATLQFICKDHEIRRRNLIFREMKVHNF